MFAEIENLLALLEIQASLEDIDSAADRARTEVAHYQDTLAVLEQAALRVSSPEAFAALAYYQLRQLSPTLARRDPWRLVDELREVVQSGPESLLDEVKAVLRDGGE